jgi:hypothetical protein
LSRMLKDGRIVRRGLLAAIGGVAAGTLMKLGGAKQVSAADGDNLRVGNTGAGGWQDAASTTELRLFSTNPNDTNVPALLVHRGTPNGFLTGRSAIIGGNHDPVAPAIQGINSGGGVGVFAQVTSDHPSIAGLSSNAIRGVSNVNFGVGVMGVSNNGGNHTNTTGNGAGIGVHGKSGAGKGVKGDSISGDGVHGHSIGGVGLRGTSQDFVGLIGISAGSIGLYGYTTAVNTPAFYSESLAPSGRIAGYFNGDVQVVGNFTVFGGAKNAAVAMPDGTQALMYCQESPEPYFEDFGRARLTGGVCYVSLEPEFAGLIRRGDYMVYLTPEGDCNGLYLSRRDQHGFEVRELRAGLSNLGFAYRVVAKRNDIPGKRLARVDPQVAKNVAAVRAMPGSPNSQVPDRNPRGQPMAPTAPHQPPVSPPPPNAGGEPPRPQAPDGPNISGR